MAVTAIIWPINEWTRVFPQSRGEEIVTFPIILKEEPHSLLHVPQDGYQCYTSAPTNPVTSEVKSFKLLALLIYQPPKLTVNDLSLIMLRDRVTQIEDNNVISIMQLLCNGIIVIDTLSSN